MLIYPNFGIINGLLSILMTFELLRWDILSLDLGLDCYLPLSDNNLLQWRIYP
jgi:hypothetical protein